MTRVLLSILAVAEAALGVFGLIGVANLLFSHAASITMILLPVLAMVVLLLVAGAAIFLRRSWSYYVHIVVILLAGVLFVFYVGPLAGADAMAILLPVGVVVAVLTALFFLPPVRRYFGVGAKAAQADSPGTP